MLDIIEFGSDPEDIFYCLVDKSVSPDGLDVESLKISNPRNFDDVLRQSGCLMMLTGVEVRELIQRGDLDEDNIHQSLVRLAKAEGFLT